MFQQIRLRSAGVLMCVSLLLAVVALPPLLRLPLLPSPLHPHPS